MSERIEVPRCRYVCGLSERVHDDARTNHPFMRAEARSTPAEYHTEEFGPSPDTRHLPARSTPAEALDPSEIRDIDMALRYALLDHDMGCRAIGMEENCTCPARGYADRARAIVKRIGAPYRLPSGDYDPARLRPEESD